MTAKRMQDAIGQRCLVSFDEIAVRCEVTDVKFTWGKVRLKVRPISGRGEQWIEPGRLRRDGEEVPLTEAEMVKAWA